MKVLLTALFCLGFVCTPTAFAQEKVSTEKYTKSKQIKKKKSKKQREIPVIDPANVTDIYLSQTEITTQCPPQDVTYYTQIIEVRTVAPDNDDGKTLYVYTVSGGKIIGSGANVKWDLSGLKPGTYKLTAGIDSGSRWGILGQTQTKEVKIVECPNKN